MFSFQKYPNPSQSLIQATVFNKTIYQITNFTFQAAPPAYLKFVFSDFSKVISGNGNIDLKVKVTNSKQGETPIIMKIRLIYTINGRNVEITHIIRNFPNNL